MIVFIKQTNKQTNTYLQTSISMVGNETTILTITDAIEKQNTDRMAMNNPNAGIRSGMVRLALLLFAIAVTL